MGGGISHRDSAQREPETERARENHIAKMFNLLPFFFAFRNPTSNQKIETERVWGMLMRLGLWASMDSMSRKGLPFLSLA